MDSSSEVAQRHGINAVPAFVVDGRVLVSGAQPHEVLSARWSGPAIRAEEG